MTKIRVAILNINTYKIPNCKMNIIVNLHSNNLKYSKQFTPRGLNIIKFCNCNLCVVLRIFILFSI